MKNKNTEQLNTLEEDDMFAILVRFSEIGEAGYDLHSEIDHKFLNQRMSLPGSKEDSGPRAEYNFPTPPKVELHFSKEGSTVHVKGTVTATFNTECSRCVANITQEITVPVRYIFKRYSTRIPIEEQKEDLDIGFYDGQDMDIGSVVVDLLILALPFSILCQDKCKGICTSCGANLNSEKCSCPSQNTVDDRFSILRQIKI